MLHGIDELDYAKANSQQWDVEIMKFKCECGDVVNTGNPCYCRILYDETPVMIEHLACGHLTEFTREMQDIDYDEFMDVLKGEPRL